MITDFTNLLLVSRKFLGLFCLTKHSVQAVSVRLRRNRWNFVENASVSCSIAASSRGYGLFLMHRFTDLVFLMFVEFLPGHHCRDSRRIRRMHSD